MKKTFFALFINLTFASLSMNAQTNEEQVFKGKYLQQVEKNAAIEARAQLVLITSKYKVNTETYNTLFKVYHDRKMEIEKT